jgi:hypothetical protein
VQGEGRREENEAREGGGGGKIHNLIFSTKCDPVISFQNGQPVTGVSALSRDHVRIP